MICMLCHCNVVLLFIFMNKWLALLKGQLPCKKWLDLLKEQPPCKKNDWPFWKDSYHVNKWLALLKEQSTCEKKMARSIERTATMLKKWLDLLKEQLLCELMAGSIERKAFIIYNVKSFIFLFYKFKIKHKKVRRLHKNIRWLNLLVQKLNNIWSFYNFSKFMKILFYIKFIVYRINSHGI
jgi:hypothetical protein